MDVARLGNGGFVAFMPICLNMPEIWQLLVTLALVVILRVLAVLPARVWGRKPAPQPRTSPCNTLVVIGSGLCVSQHVLDWHSRFFTLDAGGHTTEMLRLLGGTARQRYSPRRYVLSNTDRISESKLQEFETGSSASDVCLLN